MPNMIKRNNAYEVTDLTGKVSMIPNRWGLINQLGLFENVRTSQTSITMEREDSSTSLLDSVNRMQRGTQYGSDDEVQMYSFPVAYFKHSEYITPEDAQGQRVVGTTDQVKTIDMARAKKLGRIRMNHAITHEFMKVQALKGVVVSPNGVVYADLHKTFGFNGGAIKEINFELDNPATDVSLKVEELKRYMDDNALTGGSVEGIRVLVDSNFFDALTSHPRVKEFYLFSQRNPSVPFQDNYATGANNGVAGAANTFTWKGVTFIEYRGSYQDRKGTVHKLIEADTGYAHPVGLTDVFVNYLAPCNKMSYVNTLGEELYVFEYTDDHDEGSELESHSSILPICKRPQLLVKLNK